MHTNIELVEPLLLIGAYLLPWLIFIAILIFVVKRIFHAPTPKCPDRHTTQTSRATIASASTQNNTIVASDVTKYRYFLRKHIMTAYEEKFFMILNEIFSDKCYVIPQVHLSKLLDHKVKRQNWQGAFSHINGKSVDFVLLRKSDLSPLCAIELDDRSHNLNKRKERDSEIERLFRSARLPLARFKNIDSMAKQEIVDKIAIIIKNT